MLQNVEIFGVFKLNIEFYKYIIFLNLVGWFFQNMHEKLRHYCDVLLSNKYMKNQYNCTSTWYIPFYRFHILTTSSTLV